MECYAADAKFTDFDKIRQKIEELTDKVAGTKKGIVDDPIKLASNPYAYQVFSNDCPDLTLIDLPGITRVALQNSDQQTVDIEQITTNLVAKYCKDDERTIILAVVPANVDLATSHALDLARKWDVKGERTLGVITKIDLMDRGTDARAVLSNKEIPLKYGYVGIKNRSQEDIMNKVKVK
jgi:replication fork clamp-binding protein CrfC